MDKNNGGSAFPVPDKVYGNGEIQYGSDGMTLRDKFADSALKGILANHMMLDQFHKTTYDWVADECYRMADAMLKARGHNNG
jgi:hypothetical protein